MRVRYYVDGLNFYYNVARDINIKWFDLERCLRQTVEEHLRTKVTTEKLKFFSSAMYGESGKRQKDYHNALQAHSPNIVEITLGKFKKAKRTEERISKCRLRNRWMRGKVTIHIREEKQTDVNIATAMVKDAYTENENFDVACLVSNDSDLLSALTIKKELGQRTILLTHNIRRDANPAKDLKDALLDIRSDCIPHLTETNLRQYKLPDTVASKYTTPPNWD